MGEISEVLCIPDEFFLIKKEVEETKLVVLKLKTRDRSIPKFQPIPIPMLEFSCQPIQILEFPNYFQPFDVSGTFISYVHK